jgi:hypothetical protein
VSSSSLIAVPHTRHKIYIHISNATLVVSEHVYVHNPPLPLSLYCGDDWRRVGQPHDEHLDSTVVVITRSSRCKRRPARAQGRAEGCVHDFRVGLAQCFCCCCCC